MTNLSDLIFEALEDIPGVYESAVEKDIDGEYIAFNETALTPVGYDSYIDESTRRWAYELEAVKREVEVNVISETSESREETAEAVRSRLLRFGFKWTRSERFSVREPKLNFFYEQMIFEYLE